ncbi:MAG: hypothetical protein MUF83_11385 [Acidimicrobiales bacterium]|nr:hypothetical protein [Acidimicrobiales bacterium]
MAQRVRARGGQVVLGGPCRCPECPSWGLVDHVDLVETSATYFCPDCKTMWRLTRAALDATAPAAPSTAEPAAEPSRASVDA